MRMSVFKTCIAALSLLAVSPWTALSADPVLVFGHKSPDTDTTISAAEIK